MVFRDMKVLGCNVPSAARALYILAIGCMTLHPMLL